MAPEGAESDIGTWPAGLNCHFGAERDLFNFQCSQVVTHGHRGISPLVPQKSFHGETPGVGGGETSHMKGVGRLVGNFELNP